MSQFVLQILAIFVMLFSLASARKGFNVLDYGAKPDGKTDSTKAFLAAWTQACRSIARGIIYVPPGRFLLRHAAFRGKCSNNNVKFHIDGTLVAPSDYHVTGHIGYWILFEYVNGVRINGGMIDGQGGGLWNCKANRDGCPSGAMSLSFNSSSNIVINGLRSKDSQLFHILIKGCNNVKMSHITISADGNSPNTDGIHVQSSSDVMILNSTIATGDDCISIGPGTNNMWVDHLTCGPGHGISVGSLGWYLEELGVENVTVKSVTFTDTQNGVRIKTWGRPSKGFARRIHFRHCIMNNVQNPMVIDQNYCPNEGSCPRQDSGIQISDVTYRDINGTSATPLAMNFSCSKKRPCKRIKLMDVQLTYGTKEAEASCKNAYGKAFGTVQPTSCL